MQCNASIFCCKHCQVVLGGQAFDFSLDIFTQINWTRFITKRNKTVIVQGDTLFLCLKLWEHWSTVRAPHTTSVRAFEHSATVRAPLQHRESTTHHGVTGRGPKSSESIPAQCSTYLYLFHISDLTNNPNNNKSDYATSKLVYTAAQCSDWIEALARWLSASVSGSTVKANAPYAFNYWLYLLSDRYYLID